MEPLPHHPDRSGGDAGAAPHISVVICTHNRSAYLQKAVRSVLGQDYPTDRYELVVVDNASTDSTADQVRPLSEAGRLRYVLEPKLGISFARNRGWREAMGRYVAYLDDDAVAGPGWLRAIEEAFRAAPEAGAIGGRVDPIWEAKRPDWLDDDLVVSLGIIDWGEEPKTLPDPRMEWLVTANLAVPPSVMADIGGFETRLGRVGDKLVGGEDTFFQKELMRRGFPCFYYPDMKVTHHVPASRLKKRWFLRRYYSEGICKALMKRIEDRPSVARRMSMALSSAFKLLMSPVDMLSILLPAGTPRQFSRKCHSLIRLGYIAGLLAPQGR